MISTILIVLLILIVLYRGWSLYRLYKDTSKSNFKPGDRVHITEKYADSRFNTAGHMPFHGEVLRVRRNFQFHYEYDVISDDVETMSGVWQHNLAPQNNGDTHPRGESIVKSIEDLSCLD